MKIDNKIVALLLTVLLGVSIYINSNQGQTIRDQRSAVNGLKKQLKIASTSYDSVQAANDSLDLRLQEFADANDSISAVADAQATEIAILKGEIDDVNSQVDSITSDSVYIAMKALYECGDTNLIYAFSECATRGMYKDLLKLPLMDGVIVKQDSLIATQEDKLRLKQQEIQVLNDDIGAKRDYIRQLMDDLSTTTIEVDQLKDENELTKEVLRKWQIGAISTNAAWVLLLILL